MGRRRRDSSSPARVRRQRGPKPRDTGVAGTADVIGIAYFTGPSKDSPVQGGAGFPAVLLGRLLVPDRTPRTASPVWGTQLHQNITSASCFPDLLYRLSCGGVSSNGRGKSGASSADPGGGTGDPGPSSWTSTLCWAGNRAPERVSQCRTGLTSWVPPGLPAAPEGWSHMERPQQPQPLCSSPASGPTRRPARVPLSSPDRPARPAHEGSEPRAPAQHCRGEHRQVVGSLRPSPGLQPHSLLGPHGAARLGGSRESLLCAAEPTAETTGSPRGLRGCGAHRRTGRPRDPQGVVQKGGLLPQHTPSPFCKTLGPAAPSPAAASRGLPLEPHSDADYRGDPMSSP